MNASKKNSMNALIAHPDVLRWFWWTWNPPANSNLYDGISEGFNIILNMPIDITITNNTITIFKDYPMDVNKSPEIVKALFTELTFKKNSYFEDINNNPVFRNITCSKCRLNEHLELKIDRLGWITWSIYWIIKSQPSKFFVMKDVIKISLQKIQTTKQYDMTDDKLPKAPWIKKRPNSIRGIYDSFNKSIYYECFGF